MPASRFWAMHKNIDRVAAEESVRDLNIAASSQSGEGFKEMITSLREQMGDVAKFKTEFSTSEGDKISHPRQTEQLDRSGLAMLKMMSGQKVGEQIAVNE